MSMFQTAFATDVGKKRQNNEDAYLIDEKLALFIVADGLGGHNAGEVASWLAVKTIHDYLRNQGTTPDFDAHLLEEAVKKANEVVYRKSLEDKALSHMGTTVVIAHVRQDGKLLLANVGDSRAYMLTNLFFQLLTDDHTFVFDMLQEGIISAEEARSHPQRSGLLRAVGVDDMVEVDVTELPYHGELVLLCTDGLTDMLTDEEIEKILRSTSDLQETAKMLIESANNRGGKDNITVVLFRKHSN